MSLADDPDNFDADDKRRDGFLNPLSDEEEVEEAEDYLMWRRIQRDLGEMERYLKQLDEKYDCLILARRTNFWRFRRLIELDESISAIMGMHEHQDLSPEDLQRRERALDLLNREHEMILKDIENDALITEKILTTEA